MLLMNKNIEIEKRVMLSKAQYDALLEYTSNYKDKESMVLLNHYFDDEDLALRKAHHMLRIRNINDNQYELTLKVKGDNGDLEINDPISLEEVNELIEHFNYQINDIMDKVRLVTSKEIRYITSLKTERIEIHFPNYLFVLDKNYYSDVIDYDLEIEANDIDIANETILKYCTLFGMQYDPNYKSKSRRAINKALAI